MGVIPYKRVVKRTSAAIIPKKIKAIFVIFLKQESSEKLYKIFGGLKFEILFIKISF
jgi:hypothetical protein